jgi:hypothetical protein
MKEFLGPRTHRRIGPTSLPRPDVIRYFMSKIRWTRRLEAKEE